MNNNYLIFTDLHLGKQNHNKFWEDVAMDLFDQMLEECKKRKINKVIFAGDWFDSRKNLSVLTIEAANNICKKYFEDEKIHLYLIRGNHDTFYKNKQCPHSLQFLDLYEYVHVVDYEPFLLDDIYLVPWSADLSEIPDDSFVIGHFEINGFVTNVSGNVMDGAKYSSKDFKRFKNVLSGHFHTPSKQNNIEYIGSPFPMDFNDIGSKRGFYVLESGTLEFIENKSAPQFIHLTSEDEFVNVEGNIVKLTFLKDYGTVKNEKLLQQISDMKPANLFIDYKISVDDEDIKLNDEAFDVKGNSEIFKEYSTETTLPENINRDVLIKFINNLEQEN